MIIVSIFETKYLVYEFYHHRISAISTWDYIREKFYCGLIKRKIPLSRYTKERLVWNTSVRELKFHKYTKNYWDCFFLFRSFVISSKFIIVFKLS